MKEDVSIDLERTKTSRQLQQTFVEQTLIREIVQKGVMNEGRESTQELKKKGKEQRASRRKRIRPRGGEEEYR